MKKQFYIMTALLALSVSAGINMRGQDDTDTNKQQNNATLLGQSEATININPIGSELVFYGLTTAAALKDGKKYTNISDYNQLKNLLAANILILPKGEKKERATKLFETIFKTTLKEVEDRLPYVLNLNTELAKIKTVLEALLAAEMAAKDSLNEEKQNKDTQLSNLENELTKATQNVEAAKTQLDKAKVDLTAAGKEKTTTETELNTKTKAVEKATKDLETEEDKIKALKTEEENLKTQKKQLENAAKRAETQIKAEGQAKSDFLDAVKKHAELRKKLTTDIAGGLESGKCEQTRNDLAEFSKSSTDLTTAYKKATGEEKNATIDFGDAALETTINALIAQTC